MIIYIQTPDYYQDCLHHAGLEGRKAHKYIKRYRGKNGKWYYKYPIADRLKKMFGLEPQFPGMGKRDPRYYSKTYKVRKVSTRPHSQATGAMRYDPRYEYRESAISKNDSKYRTSRARPAVTSGMKYDPRYERKTGAVNVNKQNGDNRYTKKTTKAYDEQMKKARYAYKIAEGRRKTTEKIKERTANRVRFKNKSEELKKRYAKKK